VKKLGQKGKGVLNVKTKDFIEFLESQKDEKYSKWIHFEPIDSEFQEVTIIISPKSERLEISCYIQRYSWKDTIDHSLNFANEYSEVQDFLWKHKVRKLRHIATL